MTIIVGLAITISCMLGGFVAMGGHVAVIWQPWEYVIICGSALGTFVVANPIKTIKDCGAGIVEAFKASPPTEREILNVLGLLFALMKELKTKSRNEVEALIDSPNDAAIFQRSQLSANQDLVTFICDYIRLITMGNARSHEIEALMDEEIDTVRYDRLKSYHALVAVGDGLPALGIVAAVLGVVKAMGAIDQAPEILGGLIGAALVGTFAGIFLSYAVIAPIATKMKVVREKKIRLYIIVRQTLLAFMNGAIPQVAIEHGRKTISTYERPDLDAVESEMLAASAQSAGIERKAA